jgi:predicted phage-related endonuclease
LITEEQREQRKHFIGSSDVACLVGVDPWRNAGDLWLEKTERLSGDKSSVAADLGTDMEGAILNMFDRRMNSRTIRNLFLSRIDVGFPACANLDGAIVGDTRLWLEGVPPSVQAPYSYNIAYEGKELTAFSEAPLSLFAVVEAKSTSQQDEWNEHTGEVPLRVLCQTQWQMWISGAPLAWVPALFPDFGRFRLEVYRVERNEQLIEELIYRAGRFWNDCVVNDTPPSLVTPHLETLKRMRREPASVVKLGEDAEDVLGRLEIAKAVIKQAEKEREQAQAKLIAMLGDAEAGSLPDGSQVTYLEQNGVKSCDWELLEVELRALGKFEIYERLVRQARFRVLRHKKAAKR